MVLLLHRGVWQLLPVDDQVGVVRGLQSEAAVTDPAAVASLLVLLHDVLQVLSALCKRQLKTQKQGACEFEQDRERQKTIGSRSFHS